MADKNADFLVYDGTQYDEIHLSTTASQVKYDDTSTVEDRLDKLIGHNHDDRYYIKSAMDLKLAGMAPKNHEHPYLSTSGGTVKGNINVNGNLTVNSSDKDLGNLNMEMGKMVRWIQGSKAQGRIYCSEPQQMYIGASNEGDYFLHLGIHENMWTFDPDCTDGKHLVTLGTPEHRWGQFYTCVAVNTTSDRTEKENIKEIGDQYIDFFRGLQPVSYKLINGNSGRTHTGFIAQDVEEAMHAAGLTNMDFAGFCQDQKTKQVRKTKTVFATDPESGQEILKETSYTEDVPVENEYTYSLRYEEFIALNTAMIQYLMSEVERLKEKVAALEA